MLKTSINKKYLLWFFLSLFTFTFSFAFAIPTTETTGGTETGGTETIQEQPTIIIDPVTKKIYVTTGFFQNTWTTETTETTEVGETTETTETGAATDNIDSDVRDEYINQQSGEVASEENIVNTPIPENTVQDGMSEYEQALAWMFANGLTKYSDAEEYRPNDYLTREESAKIIWQLYATLGYDQTPTHITSCAFLDESSFDKSLTPFIKNVCARGLFKWYQGNYMPTQALTKPQTMAVLMRMFEWKASDETKTPRWGEYYLKGQAIWVINWWDVNTYDRPITRKEVALYVFRLKNIVVNEKLKTMSLNAIANITVGEEWLTNSVTKETPQIIQQNLSSLANNINVGDDPELQEAVQRMYENGLTMYSNIDDYKPFTTLTRGWAAKILHVFAELFNLDKTYDLYLPNECAFTDIANVDETLKNHIESVCKLWLLKGTNHQFNPWAEIKKSEYVVALIRMLEWEYMDETGDPWRKNYFEKAQELGIVWPSDVISFEWPITRYEVALFIYRFKVKYQMLKNLNTSRLQNEVVSTVEGSITTGINNLPEANVYVDTNLIKDSTFDIGYVEIFGDRYKLVRTANEEYDIPGSFVRYGDLFDLVNDEKVATISFIVSNGLMIEWTIRFTTNDKRFTIQSLEETKAYYKIKEIIN